MGKWNQTGCTWTLFGGSEYMRDKWEMSTANRSYRREMCVFRFSKNVLSLVITGYWVQIGVTNTMLSIKQINLHHNHLCKINMCEYLLKPLYICSNPFFRSLFRNILFQCQSASQQNILPSSFCKFCITRLGVRGETFVIFSQLRICSSSC